MTMNRRELLATSAVTAAITVLPFAARGAAHGGDVFVTADGDIVVHPVSHASFVMESPAGVIYVDPTGGPARYQGLPGPDLILVTHHHGDHLDVDSIQRNGAGAPIISTPTVLGNLPKDMRARTSAMENGDRVERRAVTIDAVPAYNTTPQRVKYHPEGRDNGYVLSFEGFRVYISGDTEDIPEMRALEDIDLAFVCMNLPFTMDARAAASAVAEFRPRFVYPYHYRGRDGGTQDPEEFARLVGDAAEVKLGDWYGGRAT